jgi:aspartyl-tRNA(Asn)/glutamyl-tRNA(Gln) amidotransferase subunit C
MKVDEELIKHVAKVARLKLSAAEIKKFQPQLKDILNAFSKLEDIDTKNTEPSFHPIEIKNVMREDKVTDSLTQEQALSLVKNKKDGYFKGPKAV